MYPSNGEDFDTLFENASRTVELVKLNGKNMYMFYHPSMKDDWKIERSPVSDLTKQENNIVSVNFKKYLIPVINSSDGRIIAYNFIETLGENEDNFSYTYNLSGENISAFSLSSIGRLISEIYTMQEEHIVLPKLSLITSFESSDTENIIIALHEILDKYPLKHNNICLMFPQNMIDDMSVNTLSLFFAEIKNMGFETGVYNFGS